MNRLPGTQAVLGKCIKNVEIFEKENIIKTSRGKIKIIDRNKLAEYAD